MDLFERHRIFISITLAMVILGVVGVTVSSFSPSKKSEYFRELKEIHTAVNNYDKVINSWESARNTLVDLNYWFDFIPRYDAISEEDQDVLVMQENVKELAIRHQLRFLPEIRKYFGEYLSSRLAGLDYKITILNDERNKIIVFTHDSFTKRTLLEKFHNTVANDLRLLGFKQIRYKWYELEKLKEEKYILYNFSDLPDNEVRKFTISAIKN